VIPFSFFKDAAFANVRVEAMREGVRFIDQADIYEELFDRVSLGSVNEGVLRPTESIFYSAVRRVMDVALSFVALIGLSPLLLVVAVMLK
ncbi:hypothetical protein U2065_14730, partial [Listeria monocytogenes]